MGSWSEMIPQARSRASSIAPSGGRVEDLRGQRQLADPLELERPHGLAGLVPSDQVQGVRLRGWLDQPRAHPRGACDTGRVVGAGVVGQLHHPPLRPGLGERMEAARALRVGAPTGHDVERSVDVAAQHLRERLAELLEGRGELRVVGVGVLRHQACAEEDGHRLALGQAERRKQRRLLQPPPATLGPDRDPQLLVERLQVAVGVPARHAEEAGQLVGRDAVRVRREVGRNPVEPGHAVALAAGERVAPGQVPAIHGSSSLSSWVG